MVNWRFGIRIGVPPSNKQSLPQGDPRNPNHLAPNHPWKPLAGSWHFQKKGQIKVSIEKQFFSLTLYTGCMFQKAPCNDLQWGVVDVIYIYIYNQPYCWLENTSLSYWKIRLSHINQPVDRGEAQSPIYIWGAVKIYYNCLVCFWRVIVFWGGPYRLTGFCCFRHNPSCS